MFGYCTSKTPSSFLGHPTLNSLPKPWHHKTFKPFIIFLQMLLFWVLSLLFNTDPIHERFLKMNFHVRSAVFVPYLLVIIDQMQRSSVIIVLNLRHLLQSTRTRSLAVSSQLCYLGTPHVLWNQYYLVTLYTTCLLVERLFLKEKGCFNKKKRTGHQCGNT